MPPPSTTKTHQINQHLSTWCYNLFWFWWRAFLSLQEQQSKQHIFLSIGSYHRKDSQHLVKNDLSLSEKWRQLECLGKLQASLDKLNLTTYQSHCTKNGQAMWMCKGTDWGLGYPSIYHQGAEMIEAEVEKCIQTPASRCTELSVFWSPCVAF